MKCLNLQELEIGHRLHIVQGVLLALATLSVVNTSWTELEQLDAANALATIGRAMLTALDEEITERLAARKGGDK